MVIYIQPHPTTFSNCKLQYRRIILSPTQVPFLSLQLTNMASFDQKLAMAKRYSHDGVVAGTKAAVLATIATAIPTVASARMLPWARVHLNPTGQALIVCIAAGSAYFIVADKSVLASARRNSFNNNIQP